MAIPSWYRTSACAELDLVLDPPGGERWAIEVKHSLSPRVTRRFHAAREDVKATASFVVYPGAETWPMREGVDVIPLPYLCARLLARH